MRLLRWLEDLFWPRRMGCLCCDDLTGGAWLCPTCEKALQAMRLSEEDAGMEDVRSVYRYDGNARQLVVLLKDRCMADAAHVLAQGMAEAIGEMNLPKDTVFTWVTMPEVRRRMRGIDHGKTLCEAVSAKTGFPCRKLLVRRSNAHTQRGLNREARLQNIADSIRCEEKISTPVLLIDDVLTTGATVSVCSEALRAAGASRVYALTATKVVLKSGCQQKKEVDIYGFYPS